MDNVRGHEIELTNYAVKRLSEELGDSVSIVGPKNANERGGLISFNIRGLDPYVVATLLSTKNIAVRAGYHCAQPLHEFIGFKDGSVRASFYIYNDFSDIDTFINALKESVELRT